MFAVFKFPAQNVEIPETVLFDPVFFKQSTQIHVIFATLPLTLNAAADPFEVPVAHCPRIEAIETIGAIEENRELRRGIVELEVRMMETTQAIEEYSEAIE